MKRLPRTVLQFKHPASSLFSLSIHHSIHPSAHSPSTRQRNPSTVSPRTPLPGLPAAPATPCRLPSRSSTCHPTPPLSIPSGSTEPNSPNLTSPSEPDAPRWRRRRRRPKQGTRQHRWTWTSRWFAGGTECGRRGPRRW